MKYCLSFWLIFASTTASNNLAIAFVLAPPFSSAARSSSSSQRVSTTAAIVPAAEARPSSSYYNTYSENDGETFRRKVNRPITDMPGGGGAKRKNPPYYYHNHNGRGVGIGRQDIESFRQYDNRSIPNMPMTNPNYRPGGRDFETFRERDNHVIPNMPGANPNYRGSGHGRGRVDAPSWIGNRTPQQQNVYTNYSVVSQQQQQQSDTGKTAMDRNNNNNGSSNSIVNDNDHDEKNKDNNSIIDRDDSSWDIDRELMTIRNMGRLAMEQELYNKYKVAQQLPLDASDDEIACYVLKARLVGGLPTSSSSNNVSKDATTMTNQDYLGTKYPSYYKGTVPRSWVDGAHIYGPNQAISASSSVVRQQRK